MRTLAGYVALTLSLPKLVWLVWRGYDWDQIEAWLYYGYEPGEPAGQEKHYAP